MDWDNPHIWAIGYGINNVGLALAFICGDHVDFERTWGSISLAKDKWGSLVWLPPMLGYLYGYMNLPASMFEKYGWVYVQNCKCSRSLCVFSRSLKDAAAQTWSSTSTSASACSRRCRRAR